MALLSIPKRQYAVLRKVSELNEEQFAELLGVLHETEASLSAQQFSQHVAEKIKTVPEDDIGHIVDLLCGLYPAKEKNNKTASQIAADLRETAEEDKPSNFPLEKAPILEERMVKLLSIDKAMAVTAKAYDVVTEHQHLFSNARIFSDIRPVFSASPDTVAAAVVVHTLNISYHDGMEHKEFYAAMDKSDIEILKKVIARAEQKAKALEVLIEKSNIPYLEPGK